MQNNPLTNIDDIMDAKYGSVGMSEREQLRREAYAYYMSQVLHDARKSEKLTQEELASRTGLDKSYISKIENGTIEPGVGTFCRIINALGLRIDIVKPV